MSSAARSGVLSKGGGAFNRNFVKLDFLLGPHDSEFHPASRETPSIQQMEKPINEIKHFGVPPNMIAKAQDRVFILTKNWSTPC